jgi:hypothetical protein
LRREPAQPAVDPLPGWLDRRRQYVPPAREVLERLPKGPALEAVDGGRRGA